MHRAGHMLKNIKEYPRFSPLADLQALHKVQVKSKVE